MSVCTAHLHELSRRNFLGRMTTGMTGVALVQLLSEEFAFVAASPATSSSGAAPHFAPKAKQVLQIFCPGAASHARAEPASGRPVTRSAVWSVF